jgi:hypothetical protein
MESKSESKIRIRDVQIESLEEQLKIETEKPEDYTYILWGGTGVAVGLVTGLLIGFLN